MNIYSCSSYKEILNAWLGENQFKGNVSELATLCGCERSYLSQVLHGKSDLTPDHFIQFCEATALGETEAQYGLLLLLHDRSSSRKVRELMKTRLEKIRTEALSVAQAISAEKTQMDQIDEHQKDLYYSNWLYSAIHILTSAAKTQSAEALSNELQTPQKVIEKILSDLVRMKIVTQSGEKFKHAPGDLLTTAKDPRTSLHHWNWRSKAVEGVARMDEIHYTDVFTIDAADIEKIRELCLKFIKSQGQVVTKSGSEVGAALCLDFFPITRK